MPIMDVIWENDVLIVYQEKINRDIILSEKQQSLATQMTQGNKQDL